MNRSVTGRVAAREPGEKIPGPAGRVRSPARWTGRCHREPLFCPDVGPGGMSRDEVADVTEWAVRHGRIGSRPGRWDTVGRRPGGEWGESAE
ncbi:hypothetical protein GCM10027615_79560 [Plantactinospora veratri]